MSKRKKSDCTPWRDRVKSIDRWALNRHKTPHDLERAAGYVRAEFVTLRRVSQPRYVPNEERHPIEFWMVLTMELLDRDYEPWRYLEHCYKYYGRCPTPEILRSPAALNSFVDDTVQRRNRIDIDIQRNIEKLVFELKATGDTIELILGVNGKDFDEVFIWCIAVRYNLRELAVIHYSWAQTVFLSSIQKAAYKAVFPEVFDAS